MFETPIRSECCIRLSLEIYCTKESYDDYIASGEDLRKLLLNHLTGINTIYSISEDFSERIESEDYAQNLKALEEFEKQI